MVQSKACVFHSSECFTPTIHIPGPAKVHPEATHGNERHFLSDVGGIFPKHEAANTTPADNSAAAAISSESSTTGVSFWSSSLLLGTAILLIHAEIVAILFLRLLHILVGGYTWSVFLLFLLSVGLRERKSQIHFDDLHRPGIQAVCSLYSPAFEAQSNFSVEYKHFTSGVVFRQTIIDEFSKQQQFSDARKVQAQRKGDDKVEDDLELRPILESHYDSITLSPV
jgi:hypothetical protein